MNRSAAARSLPFLAFLAAGCADSPAGPTPGSRPNFVVIVTDDMDVEPLAQMPRLGASLARQGLTFRNAFVTNPLCGPSRASMYTGQYTKNNGVLANEGNQGGNGAFDAYQLFGHERDSLPVWMERGRYRSGLIGKYINQYPNPGRETYVPPGWNEWFSFYSDRGSDAYYDYFMNENGRTVRYGDRPEEYITDVLSAKAVDFLRRSETRDDQPFFLVLSANAPHRPADPALRHTGLFASAQAPRTPNFNEADFSDKPAWIQEFRLFDAEAEFRVDDLYRRRLESLQSVDEMVETVVNELTTLGEIDDTYVLFTSDNGFLNGPHRFERGKDAAYEESIRVPFVIRGPGIPTAARSQAMVLNIDVAPTILELAGLPIPESVDGRSLVPVLGSTDVPDDWRKDFLVEHRSPDGGGIPDYFGLRTQRYTYVEYSTGEKELYDLTRDPYQLRSIHATAPADVTQPLAARLAALRPCEGEACRR